jgi:hypothetical protein
MPTTWHDVYDEIMAAAESLQLATPWFRGHREAGWQLLPTLARCRSTKQAARTYTSEKARERGVFRHFVTESGTLLPQNDNWAAAFAMQHHGVPTRLLDWSTTLAVGLYFALKDATADAALWIMSAPKLNEILVGDDDVPEVSALPGDYFSYFISGKTPLGATARAFYPPRHHPRVFNQRAGFTIHSELKTSLDVLAPGAFRKVIIPSHVLSSAKNFLWAAGITEFSLFPDLDGLSRELQRRYF